MLGSPTLRPEGPFLRGGTKTQAPGLQARSPGAPENHDSPSSCFHPAPARLEPGSSVRVKCFFVSRFGGLRQSLCGPGRARRAGPRATRWDGPQSRRGRLGRAHVRWVREGPITTRAPPPRRGSVIRSPRSRAESPRVVTGIRLLKTAAWLTSTPAIPRFHSELA